MPGANEFALAAKSAGGFGNITTYLNLIASYAFCQAIAFCSASQADFTSASVSSNGGTRAGTIESTKTRCQPKPDSTGPSHIPVVSLKTEVANDGPKSFTTCSDERSP